MHPQHFTLKPKLGLSYRPCTKPIKTKRMPTQVLPDDDARDDRGNDGEDDYGDDDDDKDGDENGHEDDDDGDDDQEQ